MRAILQRTAYLFWQYPILWLPVLLADALKFGIAIAGRRLAHLASYALLQHSALSGMPEQPHGVRLFWFSAVSSTFSLGVSFVGVALYCYALGIIARAISESRTQTTAGDASTTGQPAEDTNIAPDLKNSEIRKITWAPPKAWLLSSTLILVAIMASFFLGSIPTHFLFRSQFYRWSLEFPWVVAVSYCIAATLTVPLVMFFISRNVSPTHAFDNETALQHPRLSALAVGLAFSSVDVFLWWFSEKALSSVFVDHAALGMVPVFAWRMAQSLVTAIAFVPAMISLVLIAHQQRYARTRLQLQPAVDVPS